MVRLLILFFTVFTVSFISNAQKVKLFEDELGVKGEIRYFGTYVDSILPKQGMLDIRWRELDSTGLKTYRVKGQTRNHLPVGNWIWEEADWDYTVRVGESIKPVFNAKGQRMKWQGNFVNGEPEGKWSFILDSIATNGNSFKTLIKIDIGYKNGKPAGAISFENNTDKNTLKLKGTCDNNGIAWGVWNFYYKNKEGLYIKEDRVYKKGLLTEVRITEGNAKSTIKFEHNIRFIENAGNATLFEGKRIGEEHFEQDEYGGRASELFSYGLNHFFLSGWQLDVFPFEVVRSVPVFQKLEYPLSTDEKEDITDCKELIKSQRDSIENLLSGNIYIHRSRSEELDTTISFLQLNLVRLNYMDSLLNRTTFPVFSYKNRYEQGLQHWISGLNKFRYTKGEVYDSLEVELPLVVVGADSLNIFREFKQLLIKNEAIFPRYYHIVKEAHIVQKREGELKELEDIMVERFEKIQSFYAEQTGIGAEINTKWIKGEVQKMLQEYARADVYEEALRIGHNVIQYLDSLDSWQNKIGDFNKMADVLKSHYTYLAYNPYTGENDIEITTKKRFINDILTIMWPYMIKEIENETEWNKWAELWNRQFNVFHYLLNFVSRDDTQAKRTEKRVRKEKKPERMLRVILHQIEAS